MSEVTVSPEVFLAMGREVLAKQPFSVLIGAELAALSPGRVTTLVAVGPSLTEARRAELEKLAKEQLAAAQARSTALEGFTIAQLSDIHVGPTIHARHPQTSPCQHLAAHQ